MVAILCVSITRDSDSNSTAFWLERTMLTSHATIKILMLFHNNQLRCPFLVEEVFKCARSLIWKAHTVHAQSPLLAPQRFKLKFLVQHFSQTLTTSLLPAFVGVDKLNLKQNTSENGTGQLPTVTRNVSDPFCRWETGFPNQ